MAAFLVLLNPPFPPIKGGNQCCSWFCVGRVAKNLNVFLLSFFLSLLIQLLRVIALLPCSVKSPSNRILILLCVRPVFSWTSTWLLRASNHCFLCVINQGTFFFVLFCLHRHVKQLFCNHGISLRGYYKRSLDFLAWSDFTVAAVDGQR